MSAPEWQASSRMHLGPGRRSLDDLLDARHRDGRVAQHQVAAIAGDQVALAAGRVAVAAVVDEQQVVPLRGVGDGLSAARMSARVGFSSVLSVMRRMRAGSKPPAMSASARRLHVLDADLQRAVVPGVLVAVDADQHGPAVALPDEMVGLGCAHLEWLCHTGLRTARLRRSHVFSFLRFLAPPAKRAAVFCSSKRYSPSPRRIETGHHQAHLMRHGISRVS